MKTEPTTTGIPEIMELMELMDLGDAMRETKQYLPIPVFPDSVYFWGLVPDLG